jgi:PmbA protein
VSGLIEVAERALAHAPGEALATAVHERSLLCRFARSRPTQATSVDQVSVDITCVRDGHPATATARGTGQAELRAAADRAGAAAQAAARAGPGSYPGLPAGGGPPQPHHGHDERTAALDPELGRAALEAAFGTARRHGLEAHGIWSAAEVSTAFAASAGHRGTDAVTDAFMKVLCRDGAERSGHAARTAVAADSIDPAAVAEEAAARAPAGPRAELPPGEYDVVLDAEAVGVLLEFLGLLAFNGLAYAEGRSALAGRLGQRLAAAAINLSDSPRFPGTLPRAFDAEGVSKRPLPLIQDGVANAVVHDARSAVLAGTSSTGHALAPGGSASGPAPTNLVLVGGGAANTAELAAPVRRGIYVSRLWYVNPVHAKRTLLTGMSRDGTFLIEDGRIARPLRDVRFTDSVLRVLEETEALAARPRLVSEGEFYGRRFATGVVCPALRARGLRVTGATPA